MPRIGPVACRDLIVYLRAFGFEGPEASAGHEIMWKADVTVRIPNPHRGDISRGLVARILHQAGISREEWERL